MLDFLLFSLVLISKKRRRLSPYVTRFTTNHLQIWEICARKRDSPNMKVCSYFNGGDCVTIEQYVFAKQTSPTMRCKGTQKTSIIATFSVT